MDTERHASPDELVEKRANRSDIAAVGVAKHLEHLLATHRSGRCRKGSEDVRASTSEFVDDVGPRVEHDHLAHEPARRQPIVQLIPSPGRRRGSACGAGQRIDVAHARHTAIVPDRFDDTPRERSAGPEWRQPSPTARARTDVGVVRYDTEIVVFDPTDRRTHVLGGGAALVWGALESLPASEVLAALAEALGHPEADIEDDVDNTLAELSALGLLAPGDDAPA